MAARKRTAAVREGTRARGRYRRLPAGGSCPRRGARSRALSPTIRRRAASAIRKALVDAYIKCLLTLNLCLLYPIAEKVKLHRIGLAANVGPHRVSFAANVRPSRNDLAANAKSRRIGLAANVRPHRIGMVWKTPEYLQKSTYHINLCINVD